ncbi:MAG: hypothetical protein EF813_12285 [Methanosarcinales archaeon]|nr:MAG: hypothetical protein EF813_12285 [Methanosarcinales archaeon]
MIWRTTMRMEYVLYCVLIIVLAAFSAPASAYYIMSCDANDDCGITTTDVALALQMATGSIALDQERADVNADGTISSLDALKIPMMSQMAQVTQVSAAAPEIVSDAFDVTIEIYEVMDLDSGRFDLTFDPGVVNVTDVGSGEIDGTEVPIVDWRFMDDDTVRLLFKLSGVDGVSGSGSVATIEFAVSGSQGDTSVLDISDGALSDIGADEIPTVWIGDGVTV